MRRGAIPLLALTLAGCAQPAQVAGVRGGGGIVSTNPCADAMLVALVAPGRIAAISHYSHDPLATSLPIHVARRFPATAGTAEEVIALKPDLVLTSSFTPLATRTAYARAGLRVLTLDSPQTIAASKAQIMEIAAAVGAAERGRAMIAPIDAAVVEAVPVTSRKGPPPAALLFIGGDLVTGKGTLLDELLVTAGFRNAAADYGLNFTGTLPIETLAGKPPQLILTPDVTSRTATLRRRVLGPAVREARFARNLVNCGGPTIVPALRRLKVLRRGVGG